MTITDSILKAWGKCERCKKAPSLVHYDNAYLCPACLKAVKDKQKAEMAEGKTFSSFEKNIPLRY